MVALLPIEPHSVYGFPNLRIPVLDAHADALGGLSDTAVRTACSDLSDSMFENIFGLQVLTHDAPSWCHSLLELMMTFAVAYCR